MLVIRYCPSRCRRWTPTGGSLIVDTIANRLEYLRGEIRAERISMSEILELQALTPYIDRDDTELLEWAGVSESEA